MVFKRFTRSLTSRNKAFPVGQSLSSLPDSNLRSLIHRQPTITMPPKRKPNKSAARPGPAAAATVPEEPAQSIEVAAAVPTETPPPPPPPPNSSENPLCLPGYRDSSSDDDNDDGSNNGSIEVMLPPLSPPQIHHRPHNPFQNHHRNHHQHPAAKMTTTLAARTPPTKTPLSKPTTHISPPRSSAISVSSSTPSNLASSRTRRRATHVPSKRGSSQI